MVPISIFSLVEGWRAVRGEKLCFHNNVILLVCNGFTTLILKCFNFNLINNRNHLHAQLSVFKSVKES